MSLSTGLLAIKGQHSDKLSEIFSFFKLFDTSSDKTLNDWDEAIALIDLSWQKQFAFYLFQVLNFKSAV